MCACAALHFNNAWKNRGWMFVRTPLRSRGCGNINTDGKRRLTGADEEKWATSLAPGNKISRKRVTRDLVAHKPVEGQ